MSGSKSALGQAHCRFFGLPSPLVPTNEDSRSVQRNEIAPGSRSRFAEYLATASVLRGAIFIGHHTSGTIRFVAILDARYGWRGPEPVQVNLQHVFRDINAVQQLSRLPLHWMDTCVPSAESSAHSAPTDRLLGHQTCRRTLVSDTAAMVFTASSPERLVVHAWVEHDGDLCAPSIMWTQAGGAP